MTTKYFVRSSFLFLIFTSVATQSEIDNDFLFSDSSGSCNKELSDVASKSTGRYEVRIGRTQDYLCRAVEIYDGDKLVFRASEVGGYFYFGPDSESHDPFVSVTGRGSQNLIISSWSGGAHCCYSLRIFDLTTELREVAYLETGNFMPTFVDLDNDGILEIRIADDFLAYRFSSFADSAAAEVVLKSFEGRYVVAPEFMVKPAVDLRTLKDIAEWQSMVGKADDLDRLPYSLMKMLADLSFSGNYAVAKQLIELIWPIDCPLKTEFKQEFDEVLAESKFYSEFEKLIATSVNN